MPTILRVSEICKQFELAKKEQLLRRYEGAAFTFILNVRKLCLVLYELESVRKAVINQANIVRSCWQL